MSYCSSDLKSSCLHISSSTSVDCWFHAFLDIDDRTEPSKILVVKHPEYRFLLRFIMVIALNVSLTVKSYPVSTRISIFPPKSWILISFGHLHYQFQPIRTATKNFFKGYLWLFTQCLDKVNFMGHYRDGMDRAFLSRMHIIGQVHHSHLPKSSDSFLYNIPWKFCHFSVYTISFK